MKTIGKAGWILALIAAVIMLAVAFVSHDRDVPLKAAFAFLLSIPGSAYFVMKSQ